MSVFDYLFQLPNISLGPHHNRTSRLPSLASHDRLTVLPHDPIGVGVGGELGLGEIRTWAQTLTLALRHRTILVLQHDLLHGHNLFSKLGDLRGQVVVLAAEDFDLGLQICQPLLLTLPTLQRGDPMSLSASANASSDQ